MTRLINLCKPDLLKTVMNQETFAICRKLDRSAGENVWNSLKVNCLYLPSTMSFIGQRSLALAMKVESNINAKNNINQSQNPIEIE